MSEGEAYKVVADRELILMGMSPEDICSAKSTIWVSFAS